MIQTMKVSVCECSLKNRVISLVSIFVRKFCFVGGMGCISCLPSFIRPNKYDYMKRFIGADHKDNWNSDQC